MMMIIFVLDAEREEEKKKPSETHSLTELCGCSACSAKAYHEGVSWLIPPALSDSLRLQAYGGQPSS